MPVLFCHAVGRIRPSSIPETAARARCRDAERTPAAVKTAGLKQIDHLITTHYHGDHIGGLSELAARIPIREFIDHGPNVQPNPQHRSTFSSGTRTYAKGEAHGRKAWRQGSGCRVGLADSGLSGKHARDTALPGAGRPNPYCADFKPQDVP